MTLRARRDKEGKLVWENQTQIDQRVREARQRRRAARGGPPSERVWEDFERARVRGSPYECWGWEGATRGEYGVVRGYMAHVLAWLHHTGQKRLPKNHQVWHLCGELTCTNPYHLVCVTTTATARIFVIFNGSHEDAVGLTQDEIDTIRRLERGGMDYAEIGRLLGRLASEIKRYKDIRVERIIDKEVAGGG